MTPDQVGELASDNVLRGRLAKLMALECFRNTMALEDFHTGKVPSSRIGDFSDVTVVSPDREISWNDLSRLNNDEMKAFMIDVVNRCDRFLNELFVSARGEAIIEALKERDPMPKWNDPKGG